jgi:hypothetical protein
MTPSETLHEAANRIAAKAFSTAFDELVETARPDSTVDETIAAFLDAMREQLERHAREMQSLKRTPKFGG